MKGEVPVSVDFDFIIRIGVAGLLGAMIGIEREIRSKEAGLKTHFLVAVGSALIMVVSKYAFSDIVFEEHMSLDPSRIAAQVVSGVGFRCRHNYYSKAGGERINDCGWFMGYCRHRISNWSGMYVVGIGATILVLIGLEIVSRILRCNFISTKYNSANVCK